MTRIVLISEPTRRAPRVKRPDYLRWLRGLPCVINGTYPVEAAHVSYANPDLGHYGRGKGQKAGDRWCLPLSPEMHREQHGMSEREFWARHGIDPHVLCLALYGAFLDGDDEGALHIVRSAGRADRRE